MDSNQRGQEWSAPLGQEAINWALKDRKELFPRTKGFLSIGMACRRVEKCLATWGQQRDSWRGGNLGRDRARMRRRTRQVVRPSVQHRGAQGPGLYFLGRGVPGRCQGCCDSAVCGRKAQATAAAEEAGSSVERLGEALSGGKEGLRASQWSGQRCSCPSSWKGVP